MELIFAVFQVIGLILTFGWFIPTLLAAETAEDAFKALNKLVALIFMLMGVLLIIVVIFNLN